MMPLEFGWTELWQLLLAVAAGFIVGLEREISHKPAGIKTIIFVTLCATLVMQIGVKLTAAVGSGDPSRLAAAAITGIGFLGAGVILRTGAHVEGITTAATIWLMTAVGLSIGLNYYWPALVVVVIAVLVLALKPVFDAMAERWDRWRRWRQSGSPGSFDDYTIKDDDN